MKDIQETEDVLNFAADFLVSFDKAKSDDGRVSMAEVVGMASGLAASLITAVRGAGEIPAEARDYTGVELDYLRDAFLTRMRWAPTDNNRDLADAYFDLVRDVYLNVLRILNTKRPPRAELV